MEQMVAFQPQISEEELAQNDMQAQLSTVLAQALGAASTCWEHMSGTGTFDDVRAREIHDSVLVWVNQRFVVKSPAQTMMMDRQESPGIIDTAVPCPDCGTTDTEPVSYTFHPLSKGHWHCKNCGRNFEGRVHA